MYIVLLEIKDEEHLLCRLLVYFNYHRRMINEMDKLINLLGKSRVFILVMTPTDEIIFSVALNCYNLRSFVFFFNETYVNYPSKFRVYPMFLFPLPPIMNLDA